MYEIRRISEPQAGAVTELWDRMCRETPDGGPLTERGRRNIRRMLEIAAWHHQTCCLVVTAADEVVGFVVVEVDAGLLPGLSGEIHELYVVPEVEESVRRELAQRAVDWLRRCGAGTVRKLVAADEPELREFWQREGFEPDMICMSSYRS